LIRHYIEKEREELQFTGIRIQGVVTAIKKKTHIRFGSQSPYVVCFSYEYANDKYNGKTYLLWNKPTISVKDAINIFINASKNNHYFTKC
jgi:hypothetical protein